MKLNISVLLDNLSTKFKMYQNPTRITGSGVPRNFVRGSSTNSVETEDRENGDLGAVAPYSLIKDSGGSCNLVQESLFHIVKVS